MENENKNPHIKIENGVKVFNAKKENAVRALDGVALEIERGESVAIMGVSGSGKTTLLNIIGCVDSLSEGSFVLDGEDLTEFDERYFAFVRREKIGYVLQSYGLFDDFSVYDNLKIALVINGKLRASEIKSKIDELLDGFGLLAYKRTKVKNLSGGQKQRVAIARAIAGEPEIILADEPTGALDSKTAKEIMNILLAENAKGTTLIVVTHDKKIADMTGRIVYIEDGKIVGC